MSQYAVEGSRQESVVVFGSELHALGDLLSHDPDLVHDLVGTEARAELEGLWRRACEAFGRAAEVGPDGRAHP